MAEHTSARETDKDADRERQRQGDEERSIHKKQLSGS